MYEAVFWGASGQARVLRDCLNGTNIHIAALFDNSPDARSPFADTPLYYGKEGFLTWMKMRNSDQPLGFLVAIGGDRGQTRVELHEFLISHGLFPLIARHRTSVVPASATIGAGSQILAQSVVGVDAVLGRACIINTAATLDHECILGDGVHICPGAHLAGCITVDKFVTIGTGATIAPRVHIAEGAIIGAGAVIIRDVPPYSVVVGNPGRVIRQIHGGVITSGKVQPK